jgi:hypothetical protein
VTQIAWSRRVEENRHKPPPLLDQDLALTRVETPRGWGVPCPHASPAFVGTPGTPNCHGESVSALARQYGGLEAAAAALGFPNVEALQDAIQEFCEG